MRRIVVWRHGQTQHNAAGIYQGQLDSPLSERGMAQARSAAPALAALGPVRLVSSDLRRAADTAAALSEVTGLPVETDPRWREIHVGAWSGLTRAAVLERDPDVVAAVDRGDDPVRGGDGETVAMVGERVRAAAHDLLQTLGAGETAVVATHGVAGRATVAELTGLAHRYAWLGLVGLRNCHWAELVEHRTGWRLDSWNAGVPDEAPRLRSVTDV